MWPVCDFEQRSLSTLTTLSLPRHNSDTYDRSAPSPPPEAKRQIFDEIVVQPPPALRAFKTNGDFHLPLSPCYYSTKRYMASNNHHAWDFKLSTHPWKCHHERLHEICICNMSITSCNSVVSMYNVEVINNGEVRSFLDIGVTRNYPQQAISIAQPGYMDPLLAKYNMTNAKSVSTPFEKGTNPFCNLKM
jgi:hypothetical protein